jgi:hypothetical protein
VLSKLSTGDELRSSAEYFPGNAGDELRSSAEIFPEYVNDTLEWIAHVDRVDKKIRSLMDPVDLLFYEKRIQQQTLVYFKSCHVLFGVLGAGLADLEGYVGDRGKEREGGWRRETRKKEEG